MTRRDHTRAAEVLRALANENRLRIVERLAASEACVCELTDMLGLDQSTVSKHVTVLRTAGLVSGTRRGNHTYYRLAARSVLALVDCAADVHGRANVRGVTGGECAPDPAEGNA